MAGANQSPNRLYQALDAIVYALVVTVLVFLFATVLAALFYVTPSRGVVEFTFLFGFVILGYGTLKLRPSAAWKEERTTESEGDVKIARTDTEQKGEAISPTERTRFQAAVQKLPPLRRYSLPPDQRLSTGVKVFLSGVFVWAASLLTDVIVHGAFR